MAINDKGLIQSIRGAVFLADADAPLPEGGVAGFTLDAETVGDSKPYVNVGHTSSDTLPAFNLDGGDASSMSTWLKENARTTYEAVTGTVTWSSLQLDKESMKTAFNGTEISGSGGVAISLSKTAKAQAVFILVQDPNSGKRIGAWCPNTDVAFNSLPSFDSENFMAYEMQGNLKESDVLPKTPDGKKTAIAWFDSEDFEKK